MGVGGRRWLMTTPRHAKLALEAEVCRLAQLAIAHVAQHGRGGRGHAIVVIGGGLFHSQVVVVVGIGGGVELQCRADKSEPAEVEGAIDE